MLPKGRVLMDNASLSFFQAYVMPFMLITAHSLAIMIALLLALAFFMYADRKVWAAVQLRRGPNVVGPFGLLQSFADILKYLFKEVVVPTTANKGVFLLAPFLTMFLALSAWAVIPFDEGWAVADINLGILYVLAISSLGVYGVIMGGWASNSKYALLGGMRAAAQTVSYEVFMGLSVMGVVLLTGTFNLREIVLAQESGWLIQTQFLGFVIFLIAGIAESHRLPFDLPEAETELTAGFHTEYSGLKFALFFLGEYLSVTLISAMSVVLFFGGWLMPEPLASWLPPLVWFILKILFFVMFFILLRTSLPRPRFDQLLSFGWKYMLPLALINLLATAAFKLGGFYG